jgi:hypothetical protein
MQEFDARRFLEVWTPVISVHVAHNNLVAYGAPGHTEDHIMRTGEGDQLYEKVKALWEFLVHHDFELSSDRAELILQQMSDGVHMSEFNRNLGNLHGRIVDEIKRRTLLIIPSKDRDLYNQDKPLFGDDVFKNFASANEDIAEAGKCLALARATACVMHLNRALEIALAALAKAVNVGKQNDWGKYISEIGKELESRMKAAGKRTPDEQFYSEVADSFDKIKRAYRNPTMHPEKTYSCERAQDIFDATGIFMRHLATRISE